VLAGESCWCAQAVDAGAPADVELAVDRHGVSCSLVGHAELFRDLPVVARRRAAGVLRAARRQRVGACPPVLGEVGFGGERPARVQAKRWARRFASSKRTAAPPQRASVPIGRIKLSESREPR